MPKDPGQSYNEALIKAKTALTGVSSQLQREVRSEILSLDDTIQQLRACFAKRTEAATAQIEKEKRDIDASLAEVRASLVRARAHQVEVSKLGNPGVNETAATLVKVSEQQLESFPKAAESRITLIQADQRARVNFEEWMNTFAEATVSSVFDDAAPERAAAVLSGLTIIAGVPGGPLAAGIVATSGATVLLAAELLKKSTLRKRLDLEGQTIARYEDARQLLSVARKLFEGWLRVLC